MQSRIVQPGDIVASDFGNYHHWSVVSDNVCLLGKPMLISATKRNGTVKEEPWDTVTKGHDTFITHVPAIHGPSEIIDRARDKIDTWEYSAATSNCEHFVTWAANDSPISKQVNNAAIGGMIGAFLVGTLAENPNAIKLLGGAALVAGVAVYFTKPDTHLPSLT